MRPTARQRAAFGRWFAEARAGRTQPIPTDDLTLTAWVQASFDTLTGTERLRRAATETLGRERWVDIVRAAKQPIDVDQEIHAYLESR